jgi:hypothetical protein
MSETDETDPFRQYGTSKNGGWTPESRSYKGNPTIENYVALRRGNPDAEIEVRIHGGIDQLFCVEDELRKYDIDPDKFVSVFDADQDVISFYALFFLERIIEARNLERHGETHLIARGLAVPDKLIDWFITCALDAGSFYESLEIHRDLIVLIKERLGGPFSEYEMQSKVKEKRLAAAWVAGSMRAQGITPSLRKVAQVLSVAPSTVKRWFKPGEFEAEAEKWSHLFNPDGSTRPLSAGVTPLQPNERAQRDPE